MRYLLVLSGILAYLLLIFEVRADSTCQDLCGEKNEESQCWCDEHCSQHSDCCDDFKILCPDHAPSCQDHCGKKNKAGKCWCDDKCSKHGDCCPDKDEVCAGQQTTGGSCEGNCGGSSNNCWCDDKCAKSNDCCADYESLCQPSHGVEGGSCEGACGAHAFTEQGAKCYCDSKCVDKGDCCLDFESECPSYAKTETLEQSCPKDCACKQDDLCCKNWDSVCQNIADSPTCTDECVDAASTCQGLCNQKNHKAKCWCDSKCLSNDDCCEDYQDTCAQLHESVLEAIVEGALACAPDECEGLPPVGAAELCADAEGTLTGTTSQWDCVSVQGVCQWQQSGCEQVYQCAANSDCPDTHFCAPADESGQALNCHPYQTEGDSCVKAQFSPSWQQQLCDPSHLVCVPNDGTLTASMGSCEQSDVCVGKCEDGEVCSWTPHHPNYECIKDVCDPNPCPGGLYCQPDPKGCAIALACEQYKCIGEPPEGVETESKVMSTATVTIYVGGHTLPCDLDPEEQCAAVRSSLEEDWRPARHMHFNTITKWTAGFVHLVQASVIAGSYNVNSVLATWPEDAGR